VRCGELSSKFQGLQFSVQSLALDSPILRPHRVGLPEDIAEYGFTILILTLRDVKRPTARMSNMIASAVVVPEPESLPKPPSPSLKRRQSSLDSESSKRPRLDTQTSQRSSDDRSPTAAMSPPPRRKCSAIGSGAAEERKRGQRLFGALLGTLSQTSAKPAHRRRDEIEKRQQDKLRQKDEELADEKRRKREELDAVRRKEQKVWHRQGVWQ
jgi:hypothetical protein